MSLFQKINDDMKAAMKRGDSARLEVLRFALAGLHAVQKEKQLKDKDAAGAAAPLTDDEVVGVLQKDAKRRKESVELFRQGNRADLVAKEESDLAVLAEYLPKELSREELAAIVDGVKAQGFTDFNAVMRETMKVVKGRADGKAVGEVIKERLAA